VGALHRTKKNKVLWDEKKCTMIIVLSVYNIFCYRLRISLLLHSPDEIQIYSPPIFSKIFFPAHEAMDSLVATRSITPPWGAGLRLERLPRGMGRSCSCIFFDPSNTEKMYEKCIINAKYISSWNGIDW